MSELSIAVLRRFERLDEHSFEQDCTPRKKTGSEYNLLMDQKPSKTPKRANDAGIGEQVYPKELFERIVTWEENKLSESERLTLFQDLVASGLAWKSTGAVSRTASMLIRDGRIKR